MKGFIHVYECDEELVNEFKEFCRMHSCDRYNAGLKFLLEFHKTFQKTLNHTVKDEVKDGKVDEKPKSVKTFGGNSIKLGE